MTRIETLKAKGWILPNDRLPNIVKSTAKKNYNIGKKYPVQIENWLESEPVLIIFKDDEIKPENVRLSRLNTLRIEYFDDDSGVKLGEEIEPEDWFVGAAGFGDDEYSYHPIDEVLVWRSVDDLIRID